MSVASLSIGVTLLGSFDTYRTAREVILRDKAITIVHQCDDRHLLPVVSKATGDRNFTLIG